MIDEQDVLARIEYYARMNGVLDSQNRRLEAEVKYLKMKLRSPSGRIMLLKEQLKYLFKR